MNIIYKIAVAFLFLAYGGFFALIGLCLFDVVSDSEAQIYLFALIPLSLFSWLVLEYRNYCDRNHRSF